MKAPKNCVVYLALGESYVSQAIFSLLTFVRAYRGKRPEIKLIVYTDSCARFDCLQRYLDISTVDVSIQKMKEMMGRHKDVLRAKIMVIGETMDRGFATVLYVDTDTIFLRRVDRLFNKIDSGQLLLHKREWKLRSGRKLNPELCPGDLTIALPSGRVININNESMMMNSGVVGISRSDRNLIDDVAHLHDRLYTIYPSWHVEQFSFSLIFGCFDKTSGCRRTIFHYWHSKNEVGHALDSFSREILDEENQLDSVRIVSRRAVWDARKAYYYHRLRIAIRNLPLVYWIYRRIKQLPCLA